ncbi:hypothetical protein [Marinomonas fungiae]|uniref:hypothetical protein n=1 Tax=Marinomonas fungiae TaxID=1137284 RepID=UPI003A959D79
MVTFGNTAAMVALARHIVGLLDQSFIQLLIREMRPILRCLGGFGANVHCAAEMLNGFAH